MGKKLWRVLPCFCHLIPQIRAQSHSCKKKKKKVILLSTHWCAYNVDNFIKPRLKAILRASIFLPEAVVSPVPWISFISAFSITFHSLEWRSFQNIICSTLVILKKKFSWILLSFYFFTVRPLLTFLKNLSTLLYPFSLFIYLFIFNWRIVALQCCDGLCPTSAWISHNCI